MSEPNNPLIKNSSQKHDLEPLDYNITKPLSGALFIYLVLAVIVLAGVSFIITSADCKSLLLNLSTEIAGAIIILGIVEKRITGILPGIPSTKKKAYARLLIKTLKMNSMAVYVSRPAIEKEMESKAIKGFILKGDHGRGKTTMLHHLIKDLANEVLRNPSKARIPVLIPINDPTDNDIVNAIRHNIQKHFHFKDSTINRLLNKGKLLCIFDGLDEIMVSDSILNSLKDFHSTYINCPMIISTTLTDENQLIGFDLEEYEIPIFSDIENKKIKKIQERFSKENL